VSSPPVQTQSPSEETQSPLLKTFWRRFCTGLTDRFGRARGFFTSLQVFSSSSDQNKATCFFLENFVYDEEQKHVSKQK